jgi:hypothetical protein
MGQWLTLGTRELEYIYMKSRMANGTTSCHSDCDKQMMPCRFPLEMHVYWFFFSFCQEITELSPV